MTRALLTNNALTTLSAAMAIGDTTFSVVAAGGFPGVTTASGNYFYCTLVDGAGIPEIVKVTNITGIIFTCTRAQDNTAARAFASGAAVSLRLTAAVLAELQDMASKDASGGYAGLTLFQLNLRNAANTFTSFLTNVATAARTWTMPNKDGTVAMTSDITGGTSAGSFTTLSATGQVDAASIRLHSGVVDGYVGPAVLGAGTFGVVAATGHPLNFGANGAEVSRFDTVGNWLVGVTYGSSHIIAKDTASEYTLAVKNTSTAAGVYGLLSWLSGAASGTATSFFDCIDGGGQKLKIAGTGNVTNVNNSYGALSDLKLKENIVDCTPKLPKLMQVRIVNYNLKTDTLHKQLGVIAQELELIYPGMVEETPDYIEVTKTREVPKIVAVTVKQEQSTQRTVIDIVDGKAVQTVSTEIALIDVQVFDEYPVFDAAGNTVLELETPEVAEVLDEAGAVVTPFKAAVYRPAVHKVARTQTVTEIETYTERELTGTVTKSVKYSVFVPMLIKAMQEQQAMIESLMNRLTSLETA